MEAAEIAQEAEWRRQQRQRMEEERAAEREILRQLREVAEEEEELADNFADAVDAMDDEDEEFSSGSDTFMDVHLSDSSSDLDYRPEDYMMNSDSEESDSEYMSSDFDYGVDELGGSHFLDTKLCTELCSQNTLTNSPTPSPFTTIPLTIAYAVWLPRRSQSLLPQPVHPRIAEQANQPDSLSLLSAFPSICTTTTSGTQFMYIIFNHTHC